MYIGMGCFHMIHVIFLNIVLLKITLPITLSTYYTQDCPCLYKSLDQEEKNLVARGVADINKAIKRFNEDSKKNVEVNSNYV